MTYEVVTTEFRTELRARWSVFSDHLRVPWAYEPVTFYDSQGSSCTPAFWLPEQRIWFAAEREAPVWWGRFAMSAEGSDYWGGSRGEEAGRCLLVGVPEEWQGLTLLSEGPFFPDEDPGIDCAGRSLTVTCPDGSTASTNPWPGLFYGLPILAALAASSSKSRLPVRRQPPHSRPGHQVLRQTRKYRLRRHGRPGPRKPRSAARLPRCPLRAVHVQQSGSQDPRQRQTQAMSRLTCHPPDQQEPPHISSRTSTTPCGLKTTRHSGKTGANDL